MTTRGHEDIPAGLSGGRLEGISVPELLWGLSRAGKTGVLRVTHADVTKTVHFDEGRAIFAASTDPNDRLGEMLLRDDMIKVEQLERACSRLGTGKRLGTLLVEIAAITPQDLVGAVIGQIREIIMSLFPLEDGEYSFHEGALPSNEVITVNMKTEELLLQGIRQVRSFTRIRRAVGAPRTVHRLAAGWEAIPERIALSEAERVLLRELDGQGRSIEDLCQGVYLSNFEIYQALWAFKVLGVVEEVDRIPAGAAATEGRLGPEGIGPVLVGLCRAGETGVLRVSRGVVDRALHLRGGRCVFASSSDTDDGLIAHLLRRGIIGLRDREETARRLLSNKRVGTILREMGVLDERDLREMVREQIGEILLDTFRWDRGEYAFVPGPLPSEEEITLDLSVEDVIQAGVRRVVSWSRVLHGCGGFERSQALTSDYLEILDRMHVGQEEWEIVAALRAPRTAAELCRGSHLGDFRICQTLWAFRMLGLVRTVEAQPEAAAPEQPEAAPEALEAHAVPVTVVVMPCPEEEIPDVPADAPATPIPEPAAEPLAAFAAEAGTETTEGLVVDSPFDATIYIPPEEVESALAEALPEHGPRFEVADASEVAAQVEREILATEPAAAEPVPSPEPEWQTSAPEGVVEETAVHEEAPLCDEAPIHEEAAVHEETTTHEDPAVDDDWQPPDDLESMIGRFNAMQRLVYRSIRSEVGAGAANFVRSCGGGLENDLQQIFSDVRLQPDGAWDPNALRKALVERRVEEPWGGFQRLLDEEIARLRAHIGEDRAASLQERLTSIDA